MDKSKNTFPNKSTKQSSRNCSQVKNGQSHELKQPTRLTKVGSFSTCSVVTMKQMNSTTFGCWIWRRTGGHRWRTRTGQVRDRVRKWFSILLEIKFLSSEGSRCEEVKTKRWGKEEEKLSVAFLPGELFQYWKAWNEKRYKIMKSFTSLKAWKTL